MLGNSGGMLNQILMSNWKTLKVIKTENKQFSRNREHRYVVSATTYSILLYMCLPTYYNVKC